jgi:hypothetical protein
LLKVVELVASIISRALSVLQLLAQLQQLGAVRKTQDRSAQGTKDRDGEEKPDHY